MRAEALTDDHLVDIVPRLSAYALRELSHLEGDPLYHLRSVADKSSSAWALVGDRTYCVAGVIPDSLASGSGMIWVLCADDCGAGFARASAKALRQLLAMYPRVWAWVEAEPRTVRWAEWLGFKRLDEFTVDGRVYRRYWRG